MKIKLLNPVLCILLLVSCFLFLTLFTACGRRADPFFVPSYEEETLKEDRSEDADRHEGGDQDNSGALISTEKTGSVRPDAPASVIALYSGKAVILTWNEVLKQGVTSYRIYRSSGGEYELAGETVTPAFTDRDITQDMQYYYKVTAVGESESLPSDEIPVSTKVE